MFTFPLASLDVTRASGLYGRQGLSTSALWFDYDRDGLLDLFVCNSAYTERELAAHGIVPSKRMTIPHTPPTRAVADGTADARDCRRLIYVGQIIPEKGVDLLLDAAALLVARGRDVRLDIVGRIDGWVPPAHRGYRALKRLLGGHARED